MRIRSRWLNRLLAWLVARLIDVLFRTCRTVVYAEAPNTNPYEGTGEERHLFCIWHDQVAMTLYTGRPQWMSGLVSRHQDGSYVAAAMKYLKIKVVRGSSSRGGAQALKTLQETARNWHVAITPDGPRGPRRKVKPGIVYLASQTGRKIVAVAYRCRRAWHIRGSWTDMMLPRPFTTIYLTIMQPLQVPPHLTRPELVEYTRRLQREMERAEDLVQQLAEGKLQPGIAGQTTPPSRAAA